MNNMFAATITEDEFWKKINTPIESTQKIEMTKVPTYEEIQKSIEKNGMGFITYAKNHRDKK